MRDDVLVVIRSAGENTEKICYNIACDQVRDENVIIIQEKPFWKAIKKTFELGVASKKKWTLALDADVLLKENAVNEMVLNASKYGSKLLIYQGFILDYILGIYRGGGPHLYQSSFLEKAKNIIDEDQFIIRPETNVQKKIISQFGAFKITDNKVFGLHDFYQSSFDYFRKGFLHGVKDKSFSGVFFSNYCLNVNQDPNFKIMLEGWLFSLETSNKIELDINFFEKKLIHRFLKLEYQIQTKELNLSLNDYYKLIKNKFIGSSFDTSKRILTKKNNYWIRISFFLRGILERLKND